MENTNAVLTTWWTNYHTYFAVVGYRVVIWRTKGVELPRVSIWTLRLGDAPLSVTTTDGRAGTSPHLLLHRLRYSSLTILRGEMLYYRPDRSAIAAGSCSMLRLPSVLVMQLYCQRVHSEPCAGSVIALRCGTRVSATRLWKTMIFGHLNFKKKLWVFFFFLDDPSFSTQPLKSCFANEWIWLVYSHLLWMKK